jgi:hypothetical protein
MFDAEFYRATLPDMLRTQCEGRPEMVPVIELHLANGRTLDVCHILHLGSDWMACAYFRAVETCDDMDVAFLPYGLVGMITLSLHPLSTRRLGFSVSQAPTVPIAGVTAPRPAGEPDAAAKKGLP